MTSLVLRFIIKHTVAKAFKIRILDLLFKFLAHTQIFRCAFSAAGAVAARALQSLFDDLDDLLVGIESNLHYISSSVNYQYISLPIKTPITDAIIRPLVHPLESPRQ